MRYLVGIILLCSLTTSTTFQQDVDAFLKQMNLHYSQKESQKVFSKAMDRQPREWSKRTRLVSMERNGTYELSFYEYASTVQCDSAFHALLDCFPNDCAKVKENVDMSSLKITPTLVIVNSTTIVIASAYCYDAEGDWDAVWNKVYDNFSKDGSKIILTGCGGPLKWGKPQSRCAHDGK